MNTFDVWCKRLLQLAVAISLLLISISIFLYTSVIVTASPPKITQPGVPQYISLGCDNQYVYYGSVINGNAPVVMKAIKPQ